MKKLFVFLLALTVIGTTVFAQDAAKASPEAKYGFSGSFEMDMVKGAKSDTFDGDYKTENAVAKDNPQGLKVTAFNVAPWLSLDWAKASFKAEAKYNGFDADDADYSSMKLTTIVKDIYGFQLKSEVTADNKRSAKDADDGDSGYKVNPAESSPDVALGTLDHNVFLTYVTPDKGHTFYTKYGFVNSDTTTETGVRNGNILEPLDFIANFGDGFKEIGWSMDTEGLAAKLVMVNNVGSQAYVWDAVNEIYVKDTTNTANSAVGLDAGGLVTVYNRIDQAWLEARNLFGMWTSRVNADTMKFRQANLGLDISKDRDDVSDEFGVNREANIYDMFRKTDANDLISPNGKDEDGNSGLLTDADRGTNFLNTIKLSDALSARVGVVVPYAATAFVDWLKGDNALIGVDYTLAGVGKLSAGTLISYDYNTLLGGSYFVPVTGELALLGLTPGINPVYIEGQSKALGQWLTALAGGHGEAIWGPGFWFDATVTEVMPGLKAFASVDARFGSYLDQKKLTDDVADGKGITPDDVLTVTTAGAQMFNLGLEASYMVMEPLTVTAAFYTGLVLGVDYEKASGTKFKDSAAAVATDEFKDVTGSWDEDQEIRAVSKVKPTILKVRADYKVNDTVSVWAGDYLTLNADYFKDGDLGDKTFANAVVMPLYGYFHKNTVEAGTKLSASKNVSLTIGAEVNLYTTPDLSFVNGATSDQKTVAEKDYEMFKSENLDPFKVTVAFSYTY